MSIRAILEHLASAIEEGKPAGRARVHLGLARELIGALPESEQASKPRRKRVAESVSRETDGAAESVSRETEADAGAAS